MHVVHVFVHHGILELPMIVLDAHENDAIIRICSASLISKFGGPLVRIDAPVAIVFLTTRRVSQLDKSIPSRKLNDTKYNVGWSIKNFVSPHVLKDIGSRSSLNDIVRFDVLSQRTPQFVCRDFNVFFFIDGRGVDDIPDSSGRPAPFSVKVVAVELSKNLLKEGYPQ